MGILTLPSHRGKNRLLFCEHATRDCSPPNMLGLVLADRQQKVLFPGITLWQQARRQPFEKYNHLSFNIHPGQKNLPYRMVSTIHSGWPGVKKLPKLTTIKMAKDSFSGMVAQRRYGPTSEARLAQTSCKVSPHIDPLIQQIQLHTFYSSSLLAAQTIRRAKSKIKSSILHGCTSA